MTDDDLVRCNLDGNALDDEKKKPSMEVSFHAWILKSFPEIKCVCHTHPTNTNKILCSGDIIDFASKRYVKKRKLPRNSQLFLDPYFERFFGLDLPNDNRPRIEQSQGSGFIFADGLIMTNSHVVNGSDKVIVGLTNGQKLNATLIGQDFFTDLAILKIEGKGPWPKAQLGDSTKIKVGDWAIAVGNPFGLENTVTLGIISNLKRNVTQLGIYDKKLELIQTDAAINPGNSGGPLLNSDGEVIGINTLIRSGPGAGLSFAIPINQAKEIAYQLINNGKVIHPMIGISLIDENNFETNNNKVKVGYVVPNSPAKKSGFMINDIIIKVGNRDIEAASDVISQISKNGINKKVNILLKRRNTLIKVKVQPTDITNLQSN